VVRAQAGMAWVFENQGRLEDAIDLVRRSLELQRVAGGDGAIAGVLIHLGWLLGETGAIEEGLAHCIEAEALNRRQCDPYHRRTLWTSRESCTTGWVRTRKRSVVSAPRSSCTSVPGRGTTRRPR
jgi:hypothetical protein